MRRRSTTGGIVALVLLMAALVFYGLRPGRTEVTYDAGPGVVPAEDGSPTVAFLTESGGFELLGLRFADSTHVVEVQFTTAPGCSDLLTAGGPWPVPYPECAASVEIAGTVGGLGITESGRSLVGVRIEVAGACYEALRPGMAWPTSFPECADATPG